MQKNNDFFVTSKELYSQLQKAGLNFFTSVPCKLLSGVINLLEEDRKIIYTPVTREEEAVGISAGAYLAGKKPAIIMQNSGLGNSINAIMSLLNFYEIPVIFIISHRGSSGEKISAQIPMGSITLELLKTLNIESFVFTDKAMLGRLEGIVDEAFFTKKSKAILLPFSFWGLV